MKYGNYEYRAVFNKMNGFGIMQLFERDGKYYFISKSTSTPRGNSEKALKTNLLLFIEALDKPILSYEDIHEISDLPLEIEKRGEF